MKKSMAITLVLAMALTLFTGCRRKKTEPTTVPTATSTTQVTSQPTTRPSTTPSGIPNTPSDPMEDIIPGNEDTLPHNNGTTDGTVDPTAGANTHRSKITPKG